MDTTPQAQGQIGAIVKTKTKKVVEHVKLDAEKILDIKLTVPKELKEAFVIAVVDSNGVAEQYTVHRPIGITDLTDDDWVMTRTSELRYLLARTIDPAQKEIDRAIAKARTDYLVSKKLLLVTGEKTFYPPDVCGGKERNLVFDEADAELKEAKRVHKAAHDYAQLGKPKAAVYHGYPGNRGDFMPKEAKDHEKKISDATASEDFKKLIAPIKARQTFRTRGGPNEDRSQIRSHFIPAGRIEKAIDGVSKNLSRMSVTAPVKSDTGNGNTGARTESSVSAAESAPKNEQVLGTPKDKKGKGS